MTEIGTLQDSLERLPNLTFLYAKLRLRKNRLEKLEKMVDALIGNVCHTMAIQVRDTEKKLIQDTENQITDTLKKIEQTVATSESLKE